MEGGEGEWVVAGDSRARAESMARNGNNPGPFSIDNPSSVHQDQAEERRCCSTHRIL